jgi:hypothetical protein
MISAGDIDRPSMLQLQSMRGRDGIEIRTIDNTASEWEHVAVALGFEPCTISILKKDNASNSLDGCYNMFATWVNRRHGVTWEALVDALRRADFEVLAHKIEAAKVVQ